MSMRSGLVWSVLMLTVLPAVTASADDPVQEVTACILRNLPKKSSQQTVHFKSFDRIGGEKEFKARLLAIRGEDGTRRAKLCVTKPSELRGSEILSVENASGVPETFVYTLETRKATRVTGPTTGTRAFGTDFSYEDLQRWQLIARPGASERLPDALLDGRPVYVLATRPDASAESAYSRVVSYVDKQACVVLKTESFDGSDKLSKLFTASPEAMLEAGGIHAPTQVQIKDVPAATHTTVAIADLVVDGEIDARSFEASSLGRHCR
jgi:hypothetical protein